MSLASHESFLAWLEKGIGGITPDDISRSGENLLEPEPGNEVLGSLDGPSLKRWALISKETVGIKHLLAEHLKLDDHAKDECQQHLEEIGQRLEKVKLLTAMFWHDVKMELSLSVETPLVLRSGVRICREVPEQMPNATIITIMR